MLKVYFGDIPEVIYNTSTYFDNRYLNSWFSDDLAKKIIKSVDKADVLNSGTIESKALGIIPVTKLSGGTKTLLLIYNEPDKIFNASSCGDNCAKWILEIAKNVETDIIINLYHMMNFGNRKFEIKILNSNVIVHDMKEFVLEAVKFLD